MAHEKAHKRFEFAVEKYGGDTAAAFSLGCSPSTIAYLKAGKRNPSIEVAFAIEKVFGIRMQDWCEGTRAETVTVKKFA